MTMHEDFAARLLLEQRMEREAEARRRDAIIAAGPPAGSGLSAEAWSNRSSFVNGQVLYVCGGLTVGLA